MSIPSLCRNPHCSDPALAARLAIQENPANAAQTDAHGGRQKRATGTVSNFWRPGRTLKIAFVEGASPSLRLAVFRVASRWLEHAHLYFELIDDTAKADITVQMLPPEDGINYAWPGTEALLPEAFPTVKLSIVETDEHFERYVLHEFGHVLGASHEHQHPDATIPWDEEKLFAYYAESGYSREHVQQQFLDKHDRSKHYSTQYDRTSVMHYEVSEEVTVGGWSLQASNTISEKDKLFMRTVYPKP